MRVSVNTNEYRTILFAVDNDNIILSKKVLLLNGFLKKSTKDYWHICVLLFVISYHKGTNKNEMKKQTRNKNVPKKSKATENVENN